jgi:cell division protein FtsL
MNAPMKYVPRKRIDNRQVRRELSAESRRRFAVVFLLGLSLVMGMIFSGWVRWKQTEIVYRINRATDQRRDLVEEQKKLLMELHILEAPERAARIAREELGMETVDPKRIIRVDEMPAPARMQGGELAAGTEASAAAAGGNR